MKKKIFYIVAILLCFVLINTCSVDAAPVDTVTEQMLIDAGYGWSFEYVNGITTTEAGGMTNYAVDALMNNTQGNGPGESSDLYSARITSNSQKGNIWVLYKNVGSYNGQAVDLKITVMNWTHTQPANTNASSATGGVNYPTLFFKKSRIDVYITSYPVVTGLEFKYEFFKHNTNTPVHVKGHINFKDIDSGEYINAGSGLNRLYISSDSILDRITNGVQCEFGTTGNDTDKRHWTTVLFDGTSFNFVYTRLQDQPGNAHRDVTVTTTTRSAYHYLISGESLLPIDILAPTKSVNKTQITGTDSLEYEIVHHVSSEDSDFYYNTYRITDNIPACFTVNSVKVYDHTGADRTGWFTSSTSNSNQVVITANNQKNTSFYNKTYYFKINVTKKANYNMAEWYNGSVCRIPNQASLYVEGPTNSSTRKVTKYTNTVNVDCYFNINTKVTNGTITASKTGLPAGSNTSVTFAPNKGYYISSLKVDGAEVNLNGYNIYGNNTYSFNNLASDHTVEVVCQPKKSIINIVKQDAETGATPQGDATFAGAVYTIYKDAACTNVYATVTLDAYGRGNTGELLLVEKINGVDVYYENLYVKETKAPEGYNLDTNVYTITQTLNDINNKVNSVTITLKDEIIRNDIEIIKYLEATDSTTKRYLAGAVFKATLDSDPTKVYYSTATDANGYCIIRDLPYGQYTVTESTIPSLAYNGEFYIGSSTTRQTTFKQFISVDDSTNPPYRYSDVTDVAKKMQITIYKEDIETGTTTQGDAHLEGAEYTLYRDKACTDPIETVAITKKTDGSYSAKSKWYLVGTYYIKETKAPVGYLIDQTVYEIVQNPADQIGEYSTHAIYITSKDEVIRNSIEITKYLEATDSTYKQPLAGAVFSATLNSDPTKVYYSTPTDARGYCIIEEIPYGVYTIRESTIPSTAYNGEFYIGTSTTRQTTFEQFIEVDSSEKEPYKYSDVTDVAEKMQITIFKEDIETGTTTQGDAHLEGAEYTLYRDRACTDAIETLTIAKNADGTYSATSGWYLVGTYYVKETKAPVGYLIDETVYTVSQDPTKQTAEHSYHTVTSKDEVIRNSIEITKNLEKTDSTPKQNLAGAVFSATLNSDPTKVYYSTVTDENGYCIIEEIPYGTYTLRESTIPDTAYNGEFYIGNSTTRVTTFEQFIELDSSTNPPYVYGDITDVAKKMRIIVTKEDNETGIHTQGDARLEGAEYTIYRDANCTDVVEKIKTVKNADGTYTATSGWFLVGKYWVKETKAPEGYNIDENIYPIEQIPAEQTEEFSTHHILSKDKVMEGIVKIIKYNNNSNSTDEGPAVGAVLRLSLDSNPEVYYDAIVDEYGYTEFVDDKCKDTCYPYTIPYGLYTISEVQASNSGKHIFIEKQKTQITRQDQTQNYILTDEYVRLRLSVNKIDSETGKVIPAKGTFKLWDVDKQEWYQERAYPSGEYISEFTTNDEGQLTLNRHIEAGGYVLYEIQAPYGYYLDDSLRIGAEGYEFNIGVKSDSEVVVYHDNEETVLTYTEEKYDNTPTKMYHYTALVKDPPQKAIIKITDIADQFTKVDITDSEFGNVNTPIYEEKGLEGAEFDIIATEDIYTPEGTKRYSKGEVVSHITTDEDGIAESVEIYLGKYQVVQTASPEGYILDETPINIDIVYTNQYERVQIIPLDIKQELQDVNVSFNKIFKELEVSRFKFEDQKAIFGIYTNQTIKNYKGENTIGIDELVEIIETDENNKVSNTIQLPEGNYYIKELDVTNPYAELKDQFEFTVEHTDSEDKTIELTVNSGEIINEAEVVELELLVYPDVIYDEYDISNIEDRDTLEDLAKEFGIANKVYQVFHDKECTNPVITVDDEYATFNTDENGMILIPDMPLGTYYFKEIVAPYGYELSEEVIEAKIDGTKELVLITASEPMKKADLIQKTDSFTKDVLEDCEFEITDEEGNVIYTAKTNEDGILKVPVIYFENGKTYYYQELTAPNLYEVDEEKHEFIAEYDIETCDWTLDIISVANDRKTIDEVIIRKIDDETGEPLEGCEFTVVLLDENGEEYVNANGEKIYLVEKVLTDENGEYVIKNVPYGTYKFIEVTPPEGYELDANFEGLIFTVDENSPDTIIFEVTNTGDIAVYLLSAMAIISLMGISLVMVKNIKKAKINA